MYNNQHIKKKMKVRLPEPGFHKTSSTGTSIIISKACKQAYLGLIFEICIYEPPFERRPGELIITCPAQNDDSGKILKPHEPHVILN